MMKSFLVKTASLVGGMAMLLGFSSLSHAAIVDVYGGSLAYGGASSGQTGQLIANPAYALEDNIINDRQQGFNEAQGIVLTADLEVDNGVFIAKGTRIDSHMIFLNSAGQSEVSHFDVMWEFSGTILGVMSDRNGNLEAASTSFLGAPGTVYDDGNPNQAAPFAKRGMEADYDGYAIMGLGNILEVDMFVTEPGDWIRVVTVSAVPLPAALPLYGAGIAVLGLLGWRKRKAAAA